MCFLIFLSRLSLKGISYKFSPILREILSTKCKFSSSTCLPSHQTITRYVYVDSTHKIVIKLPICYLVFHIYISVSSVPVWSRIPIIKRNENCTKYWKGRWEIYSRFSCDLLRKLKMIPPYNHEVGESEGCKNLDSMVVIKTFLVLALWWRKEKTK